MVRLLKPKDISFPNRKIPSWTGVFHVYADVQCLHFPCPPVFVCVNKRKTLFTLAGVNITEFK